MTTGLLFDLQHYAVHDGPGIRTLVFLKGCPLRCVWCCNPESQKPARELRHARARCRACGGCARACPEGAVTLGREGPRFDRQPCARCPSRACLDACPHDALAGCGFEATVAELATRVAADHAFYRNSGGGVTFSGGEPLMQPEFLGEALRACRELAIHTAIETCGHAPREHFARVAPLVDLWLYDLKLADPAEHRALTGQDNQLVLANLAALAAATPENVVVRVPLIPGCTDTSDNLEALAELVRRLGLGRVELVPFHPFGSEKLEELGRRPESWPRAPLRAPALERARGIFQRRGLGCELG